MVTSIGRGSAYQLSDDFLIRDPSVQAECRMLHHIEQGSLYRCRGCGAFLSRDQIELTDWELKDGTDMMIHEGELHDWKDLGGFDGGRFCGPVRFHALGGLPLVTGELSAT